ncbi:PTS mannose/fructose/sorbose transporter subunit IIC, partial [Serratia marcescens]|nr:PTS mannose/fructose/sorbose transporter subunit IIC [Serratia marcescens]
MGSVLDEFQFHRPLVACTLIGFILGDMKTGIIIGGTLEMIALGWMNIGAAVAPDAALASIISTILVIAGGQSVGAGIALAIPLAAAGQVLTIIVRTLTVAFQHAADSAAERGSLRAISWIHVGALLLQAMRIAIPAVIVAISVGTAGVHALLNSIPEVVTSGLNIAGGMIVVVGYAMVINMMRAGYLMPFFYLGFVTAAFTNFNLVALGVIGVVMAVLYIQLSPKYNKSQVVQASPANANDLDNELD